MPARRQQVQCRGGGEEGLCYLHACRHPRREALGPPHRHGSRQALQPPRHMGPIAWQPPRRRHLDRLAAAAPGHSGLAARVCWRHGACRSRVLPLGGLAEPSRAPVASSSGRWAISERTALSRARASSRRRASTGERGTSDAPRRATPLDRAGDPSPPLVLGRGLTAGEGLRAPSNWPIRTRASLQPGSSSNARR